MREHPILFSAPMVRATLEGRKTVTRRVLKPYHKLSIVNLAEAEPTLGYSGRHDDPDSWGYEFLDDGAPAPLSAWPELCPYGQPGDRLWVRETHSIYQTHGQHRGDDKRWGPWAGLPTVVSPDGTQIAYFRQGFDRSDPGRWRPSIHMPRWASRITLEVTGVRVERLQDGEGEMARESRYLAEGINRIHHGDGAYYYSALRDEPHPKNWNDPIDAWRELWVSINGTDSWDANPWVWVVEFKRVEAAA